MNFNQHRDTDFVSLYRSYLDLCHSQQVTLNSIINTQNALSNNQFTIFDRMSFHINSLTNRESVRPPPLFRIPSTQRRTSQPLFTSTGGTLNSILRDTSMNNTTQTNRDSLSSRSIFWPSSLRRRGRRHYRMPLREFINTTFSSGSIRSPSSIRDVVNNASFNLFRDISNNHQQTRCPITMTDFNPTDICMRVNCGHIFKLKPMLQWLAINHTCPVCRRNICSDLSRNTLDMSSNTIDLTDSSDNNVSIETRDISNGFITDISANSISDLTRALTDTVTSALSEMFNDDFDVSSNNLAFSTNVSLSIPSRNLVQSPIPHIDED